MAEGKRVPLSLHRADSRSAEAIRQKEHNYMETRQQNCVSFAKDCCATSRLCLPEEPGLQTKTERKEVFTRTFGLSRPERQRALFLLSIPPLKRRNK